MRSTVVLQAEGRQIESGRALSSSSLLWRGCLLCDALTQRSSDGSRAIPRRADACVPLSRVLSGIVFAKYRSAPWDPVTKAVWYQRRRQPVRWPYVGSCRATRPGPGSRMKWDQRCIDVGSGIGRTFAPSRAFDALPTLYSERSGWPSLSMVVSGTDVRTTAAFRKIQPGIGGRSSAATENEIDAITTY
jgi:hypothetical protein